MFVLLNKNKRVVLVEKFSVPPWLSVMLKTHPKYVHINPIETYRIVLMVLNGDDVTVTETYTEEGLLRRGVEINKWGRNPEKINFELFNFFIYFNLISLDSGNHDTGEKHYNVFAK